MARNYDLSSIQPEQDTLTGLDGTLYMVKSRLDFSPADSNTLEKLQKRVQHIAKNTRNEQAAEMQMNSVESQLMHLIVPDMPLDEIKALTRQQRGSFLDAWGNSEAEKRKAMIAEVVQMDDDEGGVPAKGK